MPLALQMGGDLREDLLLPGIRARRAQQHRSLRQAIGYCLPCLFIRKQGRWHQGHIIQPDAWSPEGAGRSLDAVLLHNGTSIAPTDRGVEASVLRQLTDSPWRPWGRIGSDNENGVKQPFEH
jgi:hypothetical protein